MIAIIEAILAMLLVILVISLPFIPIILAIALSNPMWLILYLGFFLF